MKKCKSKNKRNKSKSTNDNTNSNSNSNNNSTITDEEKNALIKQIGIANLSELGISLIIYASILNILYLEWQKVRIADQLNSTNYAETLQDLTEVPKGANTIYLFVTAIFTGILFDNYKTALSQTGENRSEKEIRDTYKSFIAILLILLATTMNFEVLNC
ncbi:MULTISPECIES: hypothetical protein [unclassified Clostridium]|uniref:hypothetical protein n=1 Tax=unclassified Clostridium TaxID=2614128 RepID=UPI00189B8646|nr:MULTISPECIES: hypothetical protein [unclassified Clostridium]MBP3914869.1 hypothetical protein [Clostridium sp.]MEE0932763.1 hypothetical protein [Clostridium sp.]